MINRSRHKPLLKSVVIMAALYALIALVWSISLSWALFFVVLAFVYTIYENFRWSYVEKQRLQIIEGIRPIPEKALPTIWPSAMFLGFNILLLVPLGLLLYSSLTDHAGFSMSEGASTSNKEWFLFSLEQIAAALLDVLEIYQIRLSEIDAANWMSQTLILALRFCIGILLIQGIVRVISHRSMIANTIATLATNQKFSVEKLQRMGNIATNRVVETLRTTSDSAVQIGCINALARIGAEHSGELWKILDEGQKHPRSVIHATSSALADLQGKEAVLQFWLERERQLQANPPAAIEFAALQKLIENRRDLTWCGHNGENYPVIRRNCDGAEMIFIPGGFTSINGKPEDMEMPEWWKPYPERVPYISGFFIDKVPVTTAKYLAFLQSEDPRGNATQDGRQWVLVPHRWGLDFAADIGWHAIDENFLPCPMINMSWQGAMAYAQWAGMRLPTASQWRRAARGNFPDRRIFPWGNEPLTPERANYCHDEAPSRPTPVGVLDAGRSPFGVYDMAGNVDEWVMDAYVPNFDYIASAKDPEAFAEAAPLRVLLGGSWDGDDNELSIIYRYFVAPLEWLSDRGFRCVLPLETLLRPVVDEQKPFSKRIVRNVPEQDGEIVLATAQDREQLVKVMVDAFWDDPEMLYLCRSDKKKYQAYYKVFDIVYNDSLAYPSCIYTTKDRKGVACWLPPKSQYTESSWWSIFTAYLPICGMRKYYSRIRYLIELEKRIDKDSYFLATLAVAPDCQGQGIGSKLIQPMMDICREQKINVCLYTAKENNVSYYQKRGFRTTDIYKVAKDLTIWIMEWSPKS